MHLTSLEVLLIPAPFYLGLGIWASISKYRQDKERKKATVTVPTPLWGEDQKPYRMTEFTFHYPRLVKTGEELPVAEIGR